MYLFCRRISGWSSFWRMSRSLAKSWRELSERYPSRRTTVLGTTVATERVCWPAVISCVVPVHVSAMLVVGQEQSGAPIPLFCLALHLHISLTHSRVGLHSLGFATPKPVFLNQPERTRSGIRLGWRRTHRVGCWSKQSKEKRPSLWAPASTWNSVGQLLYFFHLLGHRREFWSHYVQHGLLHAPLLPRRPLSIPRSFFLQLWFHVLRGTLEEKL